MAKYTINILLLIRYFLDENRTNFFHRDLISIGTRFIVRQLGNGNRCESGAKILKWARSTIYKSVISLDDDHVVDGETPRDAISFYIMRRKQ
jgi:hypothetical protein